MKAYVYVTLKSTVLDPQGKTIQGALKKIGYTGISEVRQGKYFILTIDEANEPAGGKAGRKAAIENKVEQIAREVLTNPVIEEFSYTLED